MRLHRCRGQAMAEFVVMTAGCLLLLFVLVPVIAKLADMSFKAQELARYTAWERTVWYNSSGSEQPSQIDTSAGHLATRSDADILNSAEQRLMGYQQTSQAFAPSDIARPIGSSASANHFWRWTHGKGGGQAMAAPGAMAASSSLANARTPSIAYGVLDTYNSVMGGVAKVVSIFSFGKGDDDFLQVAHPIHNLYSSRVDIPVPLAGSELGNQPLFGKQFTQLDVRANSALLADGWVAQSEEHFKEKADDFVLGTMIEDNPVWGVLRGLIGFFEPSFKDINFAPVSTKPMPSTGADCNTTTGFCYFPKK